MPRKQELFDELRKMASKDLIRYIKKSYHFYPRMHSINFYWKNYSKNIDYDDFRIVFKKYEIYLNANNITDPKV